MTCAAPVQSETIWLNTKNYNVVALNTRLASHVPELRNAIRDGVAACEVDRCVRNVFTVGGVELCGQLLGVGSGCGRRPC